MNIFLPFESNIGGGTAEFVEKFRNGMKTRGDVVKTKFTKDYDMLFVVAQCKLRYLLHAKIKRKKIVLRLDGIYYPMTVVGKMYFIYNAYLRIIRKYFADYCVYQSKYSEEVCEKILGRVKIPTSVIYNGVDTDLFSNEGIKILNSGQKEVLVFATTGRFRREDQVAPLLNALEKFENICSKKYVFFIIGKIGEGLRREFGKYKVNMKFIDVLDNNKLPSLLRSADLFLFSSINPPCPNSVIEAMACGLPVCGFSDGSMPELIESGVNGELAPAEYNGFHSRRKVDIMAMAVNMNKVIESKDYYSRNSRELALRRFSIKTMINQYQKIIYEVATIK